MIILFPRILCSGILMTSYLMELGWSQHPLFLIELQTNMPRYHHYSEFVFFLIPSELQVESPNMNSHYMQLWWWKFFRRHERKHIKYLIKCYFGLNERTHSLTLQKSRFDIHIMVNYCKNYTIVFLLLAGCWGFIFWISANIINFIVSPACKLGWEWKSEGYFGFGFFIIWNGVR